MGYLTLPSKHINNTQVYLTRQRVTHSSFSETMLLARYFNATSSFFFA